LLPADHPGGKRASAFGPDAGSATVSAVDRLYRHTRSAILVGDYPPGFPLRIRDLAASNGVSSIPVREALRLLEAEGLVELVANKGARVSRLSLEDLRDAYRVRTILEAEAVRLAASALREGDRLEAEGYRDEMAAMFAAGRIADAFEAHRRLHFVVYERTASPSRVRILSSLWDQTERYRRLGTQWLERPDNLADGHGQIIEALFSGDTDLAIRVLREHVEEPLRRSVGLPNGDQGLSGTIEP
jgi:DNA-binding GntR family transcriptional regulator